MSLIMKDSAYADSRSIHAQLHGYGDGREIKWDLHLKSHRIDEQRYLLDPSYRNSIHVNWHSPLSICKAIYTWAFKKRSAENDPLHIFRYM